MATSPTYSTDNTYIKYRIVTNEDNISIPNNTSRVRVRVQAWRTNTGYTTSGNGTCYCTINGTKYSNKITNDQKITHNSYTVLFDKYVTIKHNNDGNKTIAVSSYIKHDRFDSSSHGFNVVLATIPRQANIIEAQDFTDVENPTIVYDNPAGELVTSIQASLSLDGETPLIAYRDLDIAGGSYTFELTNSERNSLINATPNSNTLPVYFIIKTELSGVTYLSAVQKTMTVVNADPVIVSPIYRDINSNTTAITENNQKIIQNNSVLQFFISSIQAQKATNLYLIEITIEGNTISRDISGQATIDNLSMDYGNLNSSENVTAEIRVFDMRGNLTSLSMPITVLSWSLPTAIVSCSRRNNFYNETVLTVDGSISSLDSKNTMLIQYQYRIIGSQSWSSLATIQDNTPTDINSPQGLDNTKDYEIKVIVSDRIGSTTYYATINKGIPLAMFDKLLSSFSVNCLPTRQKSFEIDGSIYATGDIETQGDVNVTGDINSTGDIISNAGDLTISRVNSKPYRDNEVIVLPLVYSSPEKIVSYWLGDSPVYEKTISLGQVVSINSNTSYTVPSNIWNLKAIPIDIIGHRITTVSTNTLVARCLIATIDTAGALNIWNTRPTALSIDTITIRYVKLE